MNRIYRTKFDAEHHIEGHATCGKTHEHAYSLVVYLGKDDFDMGGRDECIDFHDIKELVDSVVNKYDHTDMGDMSCVKLAELLHKEITVMFIDKWGMICSEIELYETENFGVRYP